MIAVPLEGIIEGDQRGNRSVPELGHVFVFRKSLVAFCRVGPKAAVQMPWGRIDGQFH